MRVFYASIISEDIPRMSMAISSVFVFICLAVLVCSSQALGGEAVTRKFFALLFF